MFGYEFFRRFFLLRNERSNFKHHEKPCLTISTLNIRPSIYIHLMQLIHMFQLKSPMQIMMAVDVHQKSELEAMIHDLEEENR